MRASTFRFPNNTQRTTVIGRTGTGKTVFGFWLLTQAPFDEQPYIVIDYKHDQLIGQSDRIREIGLNEKLPKHPGVYVLRPHPKENDDVENWLWKVWEHERIGLWVDEGYSMPERSDAFRGILVQGRSKRIPVICLTQRPAWLSRFVFSEADFYAFFSLNDVKDVQRVQQMIDKDVVDLSTPSPEYHARWYDVGKNAAFLLKPVPDGDRLVEMLDTRLTPKKRFY